MSDLRMITDRSIADVNRLNALAAIPYADMTEAQKAEWNGDLKGAYNASDLNRVESAVEYLGGVLRALPDDLKQYGAAQNVAWDKFFAPPYDAAKITPSVKTDWQASDIQTAQDMARYLDNVVLLRNALDYATAALPSTMERLNWLGANAIEKVLVDLDDAVAKLRAQTQYYIDLTAQSWHYCGELYAGEV